MCVFKKIADKIIPFSWFAEKPKPQNPLDLEEKNIGTPPGTEDDIAIFIKPEQKNDIVQQEKVKVPENADIPDEVRIDIFDNPPPPPPL